MPFKLTEALEDEVIQAYPKPVAEPFQKMLALQGVAGHRALLDAAESTLKYLALAAWSEYADHGVRSEATDDWVRSVRSPSMGHWLRLFREASSQNATSILSVNVGLKHPTSDVERQARFRLAWTLVKEGLGHSIPASKLGGYVEPQLAARPLSKMTVLAYLESVVECRNWFAHPKEKGYPFGDELARLLNPFLRQSLGELLFMEPVKRLMADYPWARPVDGAQVIYDPPTKTFSMKFRLQREKGGHRQFSVTSSAPLTPGSGYLVRGEDKTPYVRFEWAWPDPSTRVNEASPPSPETPPSDRSARGLARYETRYRDYLLDDAVLSDKEEQALADLAELAELDDGALEEIRARVDAEDVVVARLRERQEAARRAAAPDPIPAPEPLAAEPQPPEPAVFDPNRSGKWTSGEFYAHMRSLKVDPAAAEVVRRLHTLVDSLTAEGVLRLDWGRGKTAGSVTAKGGAASLLSLWSAGSVTANVGAWEVLGPADWMAQARALAAVLGSDQVLDGVAEGQARWPTITDSLLTVDWDALERWIRDAAAVGQLQEASPWTLRIPEARLGLAPGALLDEGLRFAERATHEDWSAVHHAVGWPHSAPGALLRGARQPGYAEGRLGTDLHDVWRPGIFVGALVNGMDHNVASSQPALGADFVLVVSVARTEGNEGIDGDTYMAQPEFEALRARLAATGSPWELHDHLAIDKPNRWHPIHLRRPLLDVLADTQSEEERWDRWIAAARDAVGIVLAGGELRRLRDRLLASQGLPPMPVPQTAAAAPADAEPLPAPPAVAPAPEEPADDTVHPADVPPPSGCRPAIWQQGDERIPVKSWADIPRWVAAHLAAHHPDGWTEALDGAEFQGRKFRKVGREDTGMLKPYAVGGGFMDMNMSAFECMNITTRMLGLAGIPADRCGYVLDPWRRASGGTSAPTDWPGSAETLLSCLRDDLTGQLPCVVTAMTDLDTLGVENNGAGLKFWIDARCFLEVWFTSKYGKTVWVAVSFASKHRSKDPEYRAARDAMSEQSELDGIPDWQFAVVKDRLSFEASRKFAINDLSSDVVVDSVSAAVTALAGWAGEHYPGAHLPTEAPE